MNEHETDDDLIRERFRALRARVEGPGRVPDFHAMMERARKEAADVPELHVLPTELPAAAVAAHAAAADPSERSDDASAPGVEASPPFGLRAARFRRRALVMGGWASAALAAGVAALLLVGQERGNDEFERLVAAYAGDPTVGAWRSPTSGLLAVPGSELLRSVPAVGGSLGERGAGPAAGAPGPGGGGGDRS